MKYKKVQGVLLITNYWHAETLQKTINCDRIVTGKIIFNVISDVKGNMKISKTEVAKNVTCVNQGRAHQMEDVKVKGCPDPPTLEECLEELEKLAIKMMNGE